jgi:glycosyltransferase involved in cell wall biosynthesis
VTRVLVDTTYAARGHTGTGTYLRQLLRALRALGVEAGEASNPRRRPPGSGSLRNAAADLWWARVELPRLARRGGYDLVHHPLPACSPGVRNVITVHDLAFDVHPELFDARFATWARVAHARAARAADAVVAVSHTTANDALTRWGLHGARVVVAHHGPGQPLGPIERRAPRHVLYVGDDEPRKNLPLLEDAVARFGALPLRRARPGDDLAALHAEALALVHPALHEGFGLTALEALAAGTPVVAYPSLAVREVCGPAALYASDAAGIAAHLRRLHGEPGWSARLSERGKSHAARYSWEQCAREHLRAYTLATT